MSFDSFFLYFVLPALTIIIFVTSRVYYKKKDTVRTRFNIAEDLFYGNIIGPTIAVFLGLTIYAHILNIQFMYDLRWELLAILTISILLFFLGMGIGGHIASVSIERSMADDTVKPGVVKVIDFFHWPFGHKLTYVPACLVIYILILLDLFKGMPMHFTPLQLLLLVLCAVTVGIVATILFIITHVTRLMFFISMILNASISFTLHAETITLAEHLVAFFFTSALATSMSLLALYRYSHLVSTNVHYFIHSKFKDGDKIDLKQEV